MTIRNHTGISNRVYNNTEKINITINIIIFMYIILYIHISQIDKLKEYKESIVIKRLRFGVKRVN